MIKALALILLSTSTYALIGGVVAQDNDYPSQVRFADICSGTLVAKKYIVTAAHCFYDAKGTRIRDLKVRKKIKVRSYHLNKSKRVRIKKITIHHEYAKHIKEGKNRVLATKYSHDIAVLEISPIRGVPSPKISFHKIADGTELTMTGSGCTTKKKRGPFKYGSVTSTNTTINTRGNNILSTSSPTTRVCLGDSGGAIYEGQTIIGINTAFVETSNNEYNLHLRMSEVEQWLRDLIKEI